MIVACYEKQITPGKCFPMEFKVFSSHPPTATHSHFQIAGQITQKSLVSIWNISGMVTKLATDHVSLNIFQ